MRLRRAEREGKLLDKAVISTGLDLMADRMRTAGEQAQRLWGADGFELYDEMLKGFEADIDRMLVAETDEAGLSA